ncbi:MAG: hypothetical protein PHD07_06150, partial [Bacteroidales bacterium]|nr:hypothetical protein [Bacteroidales bacterium]
MKLSLALLTFIWICHASIYNIVFYRFGVKTPLVCTPSMLFIHAAICLFTSDLPSSFSVDEL